MKTKGAVTKKSRVGTFVKECPTLKGIINNIANKRMIPPDRIEAMIDHYHDWFYNCISSETHPTMCVPHFGNFFPSPVKSKHKIQWIIKAIREGRMSYEAGVKQIQRYYDIYKRAHFEALKRGRGIVRRPGKPHRKSLGKILGNKLKKQWS